MYYFSGELRVKYQKTTTDYAEAASRVKVDDYRFVLKLFHPFNDQTFMLVLIPGTLDFFAKKDQYHDQFFMGILKTM